MKKNKKFISYSIIFSLVIFILLWIQELNGYILNIQAYFDLRFTLVIFWVLMAFIFIKIIISDSGFFKLGGFLGLCSCFIVLIINYSIRDYNYEMIKSESYHIVIEEVKVNSTIVFNVYQKRNFLFSEYIDNIKVNNHYDISYELIDNKFIVTKCGIATCRTENIVLN